MVHGGACLARTAAGDALLVDGAIPGELLDVEVTGRRGGVLRALTRAVVEPSPDRVDAPCPYYGECGGCDLQHVAPARQLELKLGIVVDALRRQGVGLPAPPGVHGMADPWRYRWRAELHTVRAGGAGAPVSGLGFNRARSWRAIPIDDCLIHHRAITSAFPGLLKAARRGADHRLNVLHLTVGEDGAELLVAPRPAGSLAAEAVEATALGDSAGEARWATEATTLRWRSHRFRVLPQSFVQVNQAQMETLYGLALRGLGELDGASVVDAYAGVGMLAVELAVRVGEAGTVHCIEANRHSAGLGVLNARINGVAERVHYQPRPAEAALPELAARGPVDAVLLDPPRAGCEGAVTGWLALAGPPRVVYVSCDPATLARDLHVLVASGPYAVEAFDIVDMFPQTHHVECVAALRRRLA